MFLSTAVVTMRLESAEAVVREGDCFVNVTIEKVEETTEEIIVLLRTVETGSALGKQAPGENYECHKLKLSSYACETNVIIHSAVHISQTDQQEVV